MKKDDELIVLAEVNYPVSLDEIKTFVDKHKVVTELNADIGLKDPGYKTMKKAHLEAVTFRTGIEKKRKELCAPALAYNKNVNKIAREYTEMLENTENLLFGQRHKVEVYEKQQEQKRIDAERERVEAIGAEITKLIEVPASIIGISAQEVEDVYDSIPVPSVEIFQERHEEAVIVYRNTMEKLEIQILAMRKTEEADKIIAEERAKADEAKAKVDAEIKAEREAFAKEKAELKAEREELDREKNEKIEAEAMAKAEKEAEEMAESERIAEEANEEKRVAKAQSDKQEQDKAYKVWEEEAYIAIRDAIALDYNGNIENTAKDVLEAIISEQIPHVKWLV